MPIKNGLDHAVGHLNNLGTRYTYYSAGVFDLVRPRSLGGAEVDLLTCVRTVKEAARADGSAGWCAMISGCYASFGGLLLRAGAEEVFGNGTTIIAGNLSPLGQAVRVPGGYRVSGR